MATAAALPNTPPPITAQAFMEQAESIRKWSVGIIGTATLIVVAVAFFNNLLVVAAVAVICAALLIYNVVSVDKLFTQGYDTIVHYTATLNRIHQNLRSEGEETPEVASETIGGRLEAADKRINELEEKLKAKKRGLQEKVELLKTAKQAKKRDETRMDQYEARIAQLIAAWPAGVEIPPEPKPPAAARAAPASPASYRGAGVTFADERTAGTPGRTGATNTDPLSPPPGAAKTPASDGGGAQPA